MGLNVSGLEDHSKPNAHFGPILLCMYPTESQMNGLKSKNFGYIGTSDILEKMIWQVGMSSLRAPEYDILDANRTHFPVAPPLTHRIHENPWMTTFSFCVLSTQLSSQFMFSARPNTILHDNDFMASIPRPKGGSYVKPKSYSAHTHKDPYAILDPKVV